MVGGGNVTATQSFSSQPKAVAATRKKYREPGETIDYGVYRDLKETCITWDKRVCRGNTYGLYTQNAIKEALLSSRENSPSVKIQRRRRLKEQSPFEMPLPEKEKVPVNLEKHLICQDVEVVLHQTIEAQTDEFLPEPPPEHYVPPKTGKDVSTQIENGELFIFDYEVEPILDVLINKTLEQSLMETEEEDELERMREFKVEWHARQERMTLDWAKQVEEEWVRWRAKEKVLAERREVRFREAQVLLKMQAMAAAKEHLSNIVRNAVMDFAEKEQPDPRGVAITRAVVPELISQAKAHVQEKAVCETIVAELAAQRVRAQVQAQRDGYNAQRKQALMLRKKRLEQMQHRRGRIRISMDDGHGGQRMVGPIQISSKDTVEELQERVFSWLQQHEARADEAWPYGILLCVHGEPLQATVDIFTAPVGSISVQAMPPPVVERTDVDQEPAGDGDDGDDPV